MDGRTGAPEPAPAASPGAGHVRPPRSPAAPRRGGARAELRVAVVAGSLIAVAALGVVTGLAADTLDSLPVTVAAAVLLAGAAGAALLVVLRLYARPAAHSARMLAGVAGDTGAPDPPLEAVAAAAQARVTDLEHACQRLNAVISGLPQGVLVFGRDGALLEINRTGADMLGAATGADGTTLDGRRITVAREVLQRHGVAQVAEPALHHGERAEADLRIPGREPRWLQAQSQPFTGADGESGALVVLRDVTRLRHLEQMRHDFVANVSHELRTPITSISGFVETLLDNEMCNGAKARHFLRIIHKQSSRLGAIFDDLRSLADIELGEERRSITFTDTALAPVIASAVLSCGQAAAARGVALQEGCDPDLTCRMNAQLVEQALVNLVDNAVKYSSRDAQVTVRAQRGGSGVLIAVTDTGIGIAPEHQQRIFERFYRVDRARSRDYGGTGLGLAIVKHIAQAHDGDVSVRSAVQHGSTFTLRLPG